MRAGNKVLISDLSLPTVISFSILWSNLFEAKLPIRRLNMKTALLLTFLAFCSSRGTAEFTDRLSFSRGVKTEKTATRSLQAAPGYFGSGILDNYTPVPHTDYTFVRNGEVMETINRVSISTCRSKCEKATLLTTCVAFNYDPYSYTCELLKTAGKVQKDVTKVSALVQFPNGLACYQTEFIEDYHRAASDYFKTPPGEVASPDACCTYCLKQTPKCVAWDYNSRTKICYLKDTVPVLKPAFLKGYLTTGVGAYNEISD